MRKRNILAATAVALIVLVFLLTAPNYALKTKGKLAAYRGGGQLLDYTTYDDEKCTATQIVKSNNTQIENTIESLKYSIAAGYDILHINVIKSEDDVFFVFHDRTLDCLSDGEGVSAAQKAGYLSTLDVGFGYSHDGGSSFPWRGKGLKMPRLEEVFRLFPEQPFWLNLKNGDRRSSEKLLAYIRTLPQRQQRRVWYFVSNDHIGLYNDDAGEARAISVASTKECVLDYLLYGWTRFYPASCVGRIVLVTPGIAKYLWGWPRQFAARAQRHNSEVYIWAKHREYRDAYNHLDDGVGLAIGDSAGIHALTQRLTEADLR